MRAAYALVAAPLLVLPACQMNERMTGAVGGAAAGGLIGAVTGASGGTVLVLVGAGALVGYLVGDYIADQRCCGTQAPSGGCCAPPATYGGCCAPASEVQAVRAQAPAASPPARSEGPSWDARVAYEKGRSAATAEEAEAAYEESLRLDPSRPEPWNALAVLAIVQGDRTLARERLGKALALDPAYGPAAHNLQRLDEGL
jgi:hypothetical protein